LEVVHAETLAGPVLGVITQLGGQTPLGLAAGLKAAGVTILGTSPEAINLAEERGAFGDVLESVQLTAPEFGMASSQMQAIEIAQRIGYPVLVRPSFVLGGRGMEIVYDDASLSSFISRATDITPDHPVLVDRFLDSAIEIDVDALFDGQELFLGGVMEHIEEAGIHSGDSACVLPAMTITHTQLDLIREATLKIAQGVGVRGLINIQFAWRRILAPLELFLLFRKLRAYRLLRPLHASQSGRRSLSCATITHFLKRAMELLREFLSRKRSYLGIDLEGWMAEEWMPSLDLRCALRVK
jgi:carbamoyl-phosphate synthase large subunit